MLLYTGQYTRFVILPKVCFGMSGSVPLLLTVPGVALTDIKRNYQTLLPVIMSAKRERVRDNIAKCYALRMPTCTSYIATCHHYLFNCCVVKYTVKNKKESCAK